ncbi:phosphate ABC transporter substrate-binding protein [Oceanirhabdus sp. W0125-5]|uniref:phosphate ABC transporter substrate-binding protein n=1 Tax=Oceanirhabdus sp. W0125-5 TaxID=2999116 RepID=UPI0022F30412|nr:phosphate ABC transporter substrate-binding protein [Oceanirhabdus sp. W0125-5]WBW99632.1 phosphate ABC transporter substrate-binding protein [Oceanirhabdus sp. W0125-5]
MKNNYGKKLMKILILAIIIVSLTGCGKDTSNIGEEKSPTSGEIMVLGSSALQPLAEAAAKDFMDKNTDAIINVQGGGSGAGIKGVLEGSCDIGNSDVTADVKFADQEKIKDLVDHKVCGIGFAVVVSKDLTIDSLTKEEIKDIFQGKITNWSEVGGDDKEIVLIHRKSSSGTRLTFVDKVMDGEKEDASIGITKPESGAVREAVKVTEGSISYLALSYLSEDVMEDVKPISINGIEASNENIAKGEYPFWSYEHMYTLGEAEGLEKSFIDYMISEENEKNVEALGYIPMSKLK